MAGWLRSVVAALVVPPAPVVDLLRTLRFRRRAVVTLDLPQLLAGGGAAGFDRLTQGLEWLRCDPQVRAVRLRLERTSASWARLQELRMQLLRLSEAGKPVFAELISAGNADLYLASVAQRVFVMPLGEVVAGGLAGRMVFLGEALARLGVSVDVLTAGAYKSAGEPLVRSCPSPENRQAVSALLEDLQEQLVRGIARGRELEEDQVRQAMGRIPLSAEEAVDLGLADEQAYPDQVDDWLRSSLDFDPVEVSFSSWWRWMWLRDAWRVLAGRGMPVAVLRLNGPVVMRRPEPAGREFIAADRVEAKLASLREEESVRGVLITVDSGGGSVQASERIWRAVARLQREKPVVALLRGVAASGGYYLALPARPLFLQPGTITGSIGVIGAHLAFGRALARLGVHSTTLRAEGASDIDTVQRPYSRQELQRLGEHIDHYYKAFLERVGSGRRMPRRAVEPLAGGRVWSGRQAKERGLADRYGTFHDALAQLCQLAGVRAGPFSLPRWDLSMAGRSPFQRLARGLLGTLGPLEQGGAVTPALRRLAARLRIPAALELLLDRLGARSMEPLAMLPWELEE